jgi:hypothetical protein
MYINHSSFVQTPISYIVLPNAAVSVHAHLYLYYN